MVWGDYTTTNSDGEIEFMMCPVCRANAVSSFLKKRERMTREYIGLAWECENCEYWEGHR